MAKRVRIVKGQRWQSRTEDKSVTVDDVMSSRVHFRKDSTINTIEQLNISIFVSMYEYLPHT
jgi:hypothetical protein